MKRQNRLEMAYELGLEGRSWNSSWNDVLKNLIEWSASSIHYAEWLKGREQWKLAQNTKE